MNHLKVLVVLILCMATSLPAGAASVTVPPTTVSTFSIVGDAWSSPTSIIGSDEARASVTTSLPANPSDLLLLRDFDFSGIPAGSVIDGLILSIEGQESGAAVDPAFAAGASTDSPFELLSITDYLATGDEAFLTGGATDVVYTIGSPTDAWDGGTNAINLVLSDLLNPDFTVFISALDRVQLGTSTYQIDDVQLTIHFSAAPPLGNPRAPILTSIALLLASAYAFSATRRKSAPEAQRTHSRS